MSNLAELWRETFENWPPAFRRKGVVLPIGSEPIPFTDFLMTPTILVLERATPDNAGARRVAVPFERIETLKYTEPLKTEQFLEAGFSKGKTESAPVTRRIAPSPVAPVPVGHANQQPVQQQQQQPAPVAPQLAPTIGPRAVSDILQNPQAAPQQPSQG